MIRPSFTVEGDVLVLDEDITIAGFLIPRGFRFNGHSVPWPLVYIVGTRYDEEYLLPALLHDYLYYIKVDRKEADLMYYQVMLDQKCDWALACYSAVRMFGWMRYK